MKQLKITFVSMLLLLFIACSKDNDPVKNKAPESFSLIKIENNATEIELLPVFRWQTSTDPEGDNVLYDFYLDTDIDPSTKLGSNLTSTSYEVSSLLDFNTIYFWKIIAKDVEGNFTESQVFKFTTKEGFIGNINSVEDFYTPEHVTALDSLGFTFNFGNTPPNLDGIYIFSPLILEKSTVSGDVIGMRFPDYLATISNQDNTALTIDFSGKSGSQTDFGEGTFISGEGEKFTIYLKLTSQIGSYPAESTMTISGSIGDNGLNNIQIAALMLDNKGNVQGLYIPNDTGRFLIDQDGFSPKLISSDKSSATRDTSINFSSLLSSKFQK